MIFHLLAFLAGWRECRADPYTTTNGSLTRTYDAGRSLARVITLPRGAKR